MVWLYGHQEGANTDMSVSDKAMKLAIKDKYETTFSYLDLTSVLQLAMIALKVPLDSF